MNLRKLLFPSDTAAVDNHLDGAHVISASGKEILHVKTDRVQIPLVRYQTDLAVLDRIDALIWSCAAQSKNIKHISDLKSCVVLYAKGRGLEACRDLGILAVEARGCWGPSADCRNMVAGLPKPRHLGVYVKSDLGYEGLLVFPQGLVFATV